MAKEEPKLQGFVDPYLTAPFPEGAGQAPLPVPPSPTSRRKGLGAMVEMMAKLIPPSERFSGKETSNVYEDLNEFEELCRANDIPEDRWASILPFILKDDARRYLRAQPKVIEQNYSTPKQQMI